MADDIVLGAKHLKNPKGIKLQLDSDVSPKRKPATSGYVKMDAGNYYKGDSGMDTSNPPQSGIVPPEKKHPIDELFGKGIKRSNGPMVPKDHPAIQETEN